MSHKLFNLIAGVVLLGATVFGFFWLWNQSRTVKSTYVVPESLKTVNIEDIKNEAKDLLSGLENNANVPLTTPIQKMGRDNPFAGP
jgi:uncharacterized membrane protein